MSELPYPPPEIVASQRRRAGFFSILMIILFGGLVLRLVYINTVMADRLCHIANTQYDSCARIPARRGSILDVRGRVLASSHMRHSVFADPGIIERPDLVAVELAPILEMAAGEIENAIRSSSAPRFCWLKRRVDDAQAEAVEDLNIRGVGMRCEFQRCWSMGTTAAHVLGFTGADGRGLEGLERVHNNYLAGTDGRRSILRDARRRPIGMGSDAIVNPTDGGHLVLTLDSVLQQMVEERLRRQIESFGAESGVAIVMSPVTGDVLAMASEPTFEPAKYREYKEDCLRNRAITDPVEPGSTFKPFIAAGALEGGYIDLREKIDCHNGLHYFGSRRMHDTKPHGLMDLRDIIVYSSNIGMGIIGTRMGNEALHQVVTRLGYGSPTQIGLPGESSGIVLPVSRWTSYSATSVPMGQELAVTPMQLATAFCAVVNGGYLVRPRVVRSMLTADYEVVESYEDPEIIRRVLRSSVARYMTEEVMPGVVERGGKELDVGEFTLCGKTGTAQVPYSPESGKRGYEPGAYLSSFIGAAPVDNPEIVVLVMIRKPEASRGHYGRYVAGPVVRDVVRAALHYLQIPSDHRVAQTN